MKYQFKNNLSCTLQLPGENGNMCIIGPNQKIVLDEFFKRYVPKHLSIIRVCDNEENIINISRSNIVKTKVIKPVNVAANINKIDVIINKIESKPIKKDFRKLSSNIRPNVGNSAKQIVGRGIISREHATTFSKSRIAENSINISNNIGIGILSHNRLESLIPLIESIRKYTDLTKTTVFVSDESTDNKVWEWLKNQKDIVVMHNDRKGIAVNTNRLLRCLSRFKYKILLNDDVEILREGWDNFYFQNNFNIKCFCYYQDGVYGASRPKNSGIIKISDKPHGAVIAFDNDVFNKVGYFDENFGNYGYEHVDYCMRINRAFGLENIFYDIDKSDQYFKIHNDKSSVENKQKDFKIAKEYFNNIKNDVNRIWVDTTNNSIVPSISYVIPFRDIGRSKCVELVINNIRAQKYPNIQIILAEQDQTKKMKDIQCIDNIFIKNWIDNMQFCKSAAFNNGVFTSKYNKIILHDADMIVRSDYTKMISELLDNYESVHIGKNVCYMNNKSTDNIISIKSINFENIESDRLVNYYEGGSLAILKNSYFRIGGFCEDFIGYGNEDTEFYKRMVENTKSFTERSIDLFHLWHDRTEGWSECHAKNTIIQNNMSKMNNKLLIEKLNLHLRNKYNWS